MSFGYFCSIRLFLILLATLSLSESEDPYDPSLKPPVMSSNATDQLNPAAFLETRFEKLEEEVSSRIKWKYKTLEGKPIAVFDSLFNRTSLRALQLYVATSGWWRFVHQDPYENMPQEPTDNLVWQATFDAAVFAKTRIGVAVRQAVELTSGSPGPYYPYDVTTKIARRCDNTRVHVHSPGGEDFSSVIYLNDGWRKNDYGDMLLFDEDMEIVAPVKPNMGRLVVWHGSVPYLSRPPSVNVRYGQKMLFIRWTKNASKAVEWEMQRLKLNTHYKDGYFKGFPSPKGSSSEKKLDISKLEVGRYMTASQKGIFVFDDLFTKEELDSLRSHVINHGKYFYDDSLEHDSDNVQWISGYDVDSYVQSSYWERTRQVAEYVSGGRDGWFPYDISCNLIRATDHTRIHLDCKKTDDQWTFLLYLSPNWTENDYGETAFFDREEEGAELVTEVRPKYGRVCIFHGTIPHSARPPGVSFLGGRYSFAVKMAHSTWQAKVNELVEKMQHGDNQDFLAQLVSVLSSGQLSEFVDYWIGHNVFGAAPETKLAKLERGIPVDDDDDDEDEEEPPGGGDEEGEEEDLEEDSNNKQEMFRLFGDAMTEGMGVVSGLLDSRGDYGSSAQKTAKRLAGNLPELRRVMKEFDSSFQKRQDDLNHELEVLL